MYIKYFPNIKEIYKKWYGMVHRCYNQTDVGYKYYGLKGVEVCEEWKDDYQAFLDWSLANGWQKGLEIDKDIIPGKLGIPAKLYSPEMCCWVTTEENQAERNKNLKKFIYKGVEYNITQLAKMANKHRVTLDLMINKMGIPVDEAVETEIRINLKRQDAADEKEKVRGLKVFLLVNGKWLECLLTDEKKKVIFRLIDKEKIKLLKP